MHALYECAMYVGHERSNIATYIPTICTYIYQTVDCFYLGHDFIFLAILIMHTMNVGTKSNSLTV